VFATVSRVKYTATVFLFHVQEPQQCLLAVIQIAAVNARGYQSYRGRLQKFLSQHLIAGASDFVCLEENLYIPDLYEVAAEYLTRLTQHGDVILTVLFQHPSVIKDLVFMLVVPNFEFLLFRHSHFIDAVLTNIRNRADIIDV
jgi:hypothetical protein